VLPRRLVLAAAIVAGGMALLAVLVPPARLAVTLGHPLTSTADAGPEVLAVAMAAAGCWLALLWLSLAVVIAAVAAGTGEPARLARHVAMRALPRTWRQLLLCGVGVAVVTGTAGPAVADGPPALRPAVAAPLAGPYLDWPVAGPGNERARSAPPPAWVVVRSGDSLWSIARDHLPREASVAEVSAAWPRWYAANRQTVGSRPSLLLPGQHLVAPTEPSGGRS